MSSTARLHSRPSSSVSAAPAGLHRLDIGSRRDSYFYIPPHYDPARPAPLVLLLHGAGGHSHDGLGLLRHLADDNGMILVAPASSEPTWDVIATRSYGNDVALVDQALQYMFGHSVVDASHLAIGGFSDGASYALSLGLANGDLFTHVIAFSPGFIAPLSPRGQPGIFISHGRLDKVLPIDACSRRIVPELQRAKYTVRYAEFDGGHTIPTGIAQSAVDWFLAKI